MRPTRSDISRQMREQVERLTRMVDDLFEMSRVHAGTLRLQVATVPLEEAVNQALEASAPVAEAGGVRLAGHAEPGAVVRADPHELSRLMGTSSPTPSGTPRARVGSKWPPAWPAAPWSSRSATRAASESDLPRLFEVGWRGETARTPASGVGSGLGLAIVRGIAEAHDGSVTVSNSDQGVDSSSGCRAESSSARTGLPPSAPAHAVATPDSPGRREIGGTAWSQAAYPQPPEHT